VSISKWVGVHPFVADRVRYILRVADAYGGNHTVTSGVRTAQRQFDIWHDPRRDFPAAFPGCSQHQYGLAMDVKFQKNDWQQWYLASARNLGLTTVPNDPVHVQGVPGATFRDLTSRLNLCPDPWYVKLEVAIETDLFTADFQNTRRAGLRG